MAMQPAPRGESQVTASTRRAAAPDIAGYVFLFFFALRVSLSPPLLNLFIPYSSDGGAAIFKIHVGSIGMILLSAGYLSPVLRNVQRKDRIVLVGLLGLLGTSVFLIVGTLISARLGNGQTQSIGYMIDSIMAGALASLFVLGMNERQRRMIPMIVVGYAIVNALFSLLEFALHKHLLLKPMGGLEFFRPAALSGHPLFTGVWCIIGLLAVRYIRWPPLVRIGVQTILVAATVSAGARLGTVIIAVCFGISLVMPPDGSKTFTTHRMRQAYFSLLALLGIAPLGIAAARALGFLARFDALGAYDQSAATRVNVYELFGMMTPSELMFGMPLKVAQDLLIRKTHIQVIESSFVIYVVQFGMIGAVLLSAALIFGLICLALRSYRTGILLIAAFALSCGGTIVLSLKGAEITTIFVLLVAMRRPPVRTSSGRTRVKSPQTVDMPAKTVDLGSSGVTA